MHRVACAVGDHMADQGMSEKGNVADQVQNFVAAEFVRKSQTLRIHNAFLIQDHHVFKRAALDQAALQQHFDLGEEAESPGRSNIFFI